MLRCCCMRPAILRPDTPDFPPLTAATPEGLLAVGGDLSPLRLLTAYSKGIFPWYSENSPILWWSPDPRCILPLEALRVSRRLQRRLKQHIFRCTLDTAFEDVLAGCATQYRPGQGGTWLIPEMRAAYARLHALGFAHSAEAWLGDTLVGGVYGVALGRAFFGESMFHTHADASKAALVFLVERLRAAGYTLFDCQQATPHMLRLGATCVPRADFICMLEQALVP